MDLEKAKEKAYQLLLDLGFSEISCHFLLSNVRWTNEEN